MREPRALALALFVAGVVSDARAQEAVPEPGPWGALRVVAALLATLALIFVVAAFLRKMPLAARTAEDLRLETRLAVSRGGQVAVVRVDGRRMLLGITAAQVNLIAELREGAPDAPSDKNAFERLVAGMLGRGAPTP